MTPGFLQKNGKGYVSTSGDWKSRKHVWNGRWARALRRQVSGKLKTTCKDRWRQVINEADRLRDKPKFLCTLQQGISPAQMDEMQAENVVLVVPRPYIMSYPRDRQDRIWTLARFISYVREVERV